MREVVWGEGKAEGEEKGRWVVKRIRWNRMVEMGKERDREQGKRYLD